MNDVCRPLKVRQQEVLDMLDAMQAAGIRAGFRPLIGQRVDMDNLGSLTLENHWDEKRTKAVLEHYKFLVGHPVVEDVMLAHEAYKHTDREIRDEMRRVVKRWSKNKIRLRVYLGDTVSFGRGSSDYGDEGHHIIHWGMIGSAMGNGATMADIMRRSYAQAPIYVHLNVGMDDNAKQITQAVLHGARFRPDVLMVRLADDAGQSRPATPTVLEGIREAHSRLHRFDG